MIIIGHCRGFTWNVQVKPNGQPPEAGKKALDSILKALNNLPSVARVTGNYLQDPMVLETAEKVMKMTGRSVAILLPEETELFQNIRGAGA